MTCASMLAVKAIGMCGHAVIPGETFGCYVSQVKHLDVVGHVADISVAMRTFYA